MRRALVIVPLAALAVLAIVAIVLGRGGGVGAAAGPADGPMTVVRGRLAPPIEGSGFSLFLRFRPPDAPADHAGPLTEPVLHIKTACRVGDRVLADNGLWMPHHHDEDLPDGVDENLAFSASDALPARPDRCEVAIRLYKGLTPTDEIHRSCLAGGETASDGPCDPPVVDHPPAGSEPIVSDVTASVDKLGLVVGWTVTGAGRPDHDRDVDLTGDCRGLDGSQSISTGCSPSSGELEPGESMHCAEIVAQTGASLDRCELHFVDEVGVTPGPALGVFCATVGGGPAPPGPCP